MNINKKHFKKTYNFSNLLYFELNIYFQNNMSLNIFIIRIFKNVRKHNTLLEKENLKHI